MINQKGQAFSVFELMIAGVVAFAILMVLLPIIANIWNGTGADPIPSISDSIKTVGTSGTLSTVPFVLKKDLSISSTNLASKTDLDKESFIFTMGEFTSEDKIETDGTYLKYLGPNGEKTISAIVVCEQTNSDLATSLGRMEASKYDLSLASNGCARDGLLCCVIIPTRSSGKK